MAKGKRRKQIAHSKKSKTRTAVKPPAPPAEKPSPDAAAPPGSFTRRQLAEAFRVHIQTVTGWEQDGLPVETRGGPGRPSFYSLPDCVQWRIERELLARGVGGEAGAISPQNERAMLDRKRREELELRMQKQRGELVSVDEAARDFADVANAVKSRLRRIPDAVADRLLAATADGPSAVKTMLLAEIDEALRELAARADELTSPAAEPETGAA